MNELFYVENENLAQGMGHKCPCRSRLLEQYSNLHSEILVQDPHTPLRPARCENKALKTTSDPCTELSGFT